MGIDLKELKVGRDLLYFQFSLVYCSDYKFHEFWTQIIDCVTETELGLFEQIQMFALKAIALKIKVL